jgi:predicted glycosyltransferase
LTSHLRALKTLFTKHESDYMTQAVRLDVLIYAHDGRGLGHASRSIGVGMALRRLYPELRVLFVSGCNLSQELIGRAPLDWLKLPSYATTVVDGKSVGVTGKSNFSDPQLGQLRSLELAHLVSLYRPRLVLVDHTPQGKHRELVPALTVDGGEDTLWLLGVRGVIGAVKQARSALAGNLFQDHYHALLWYGDSSVLGHAHCTQLQQQYNTVPVECGYVLRLAEFSHWNKRRQLGVEEAIAGTISIPWLGEKTMDFLTVLARVLPKIPRSFGIWRLFIDTDSSFGLGQKVSELFGEENNCRLEPPGGRYASALLGSKTAVIYGGYNSLMDVIFAQIPAVVILREMQDEEQQLHLQKLKEAVGGALVIVSETKVSAKELEKLLLANLQSDRLVPACLNTNGAACAAQYIRSLLS